MFFCEKKTSLRGMWIQEPMNCWGSLEFHRIPWIPRKKTNIGARKLFCIDFNCFLYQFLSNVNKVFGKKLQKNTKNHDFFARTVFFCGKNAPARNVDPAAHELLGVSGIPQNSMDPREKKQTLGARNFSS